DEVGPTIFCRAGVMHLGDVRVVHHRQRLPLGFEATDHLAGVHARPDHLERDAAADWPLLLGEEHDAEATFADLLEQLVSSDGRAGVYVEARIDRRNRDCSLIEKRAGLTVS